MPTEKYGETPHKLSHQAEYDADNPSVRDAGIGTLGEKTLHAALKNYYEPDAAFREIKYQGCVADIMRGDNIIEIQTSNFIKLKPKLSRFCKTKKVTVVYPVARRKMILTIDPSTGAASSTRKSPKTGSPYEIYSELTHIIPFLDEPNLRFRVVMVDVDEYRVPREKWGGKRKAFTRTERIPTAIGEEYEVGYSVGWDALIPDEIKTMEYFTIKDFAKFSSLKYHAANAAVNMLVYAKAAKRIPKPESLKIAPKKRGEKLSEAEAAAREAIKKDGSRNFYQLLKISPDIPEK
ncbi:MAG TPA: hypothetical protein GX704_05235 [Clostridiales bacterium]|jgi:hypothetical protein|nr:hypothetical protein [Clostridiales bacterium]